MQSLTEKQAKERRESRMGRNAFLDSLNDRFGSPFIHTPLWVVKVILCCNMYACSSHWHYIPVNVYIREKQIKAIEESFRAAKSRPVHQTKRGMQAEWVMPLLPDFDRYLLLRCCFICTLFLFDTRCGAGILLSMPSYPFISISMKRKGPCFMVQNFIFFNSNPWFFPLFLHYLFWGITAPKFTLGSILEG